MDMDMEKNKDHKRFEKMDVTPGEGEMIPLSPVEMPEEKPKKSHAKSKSKKEDVTPEEFPEEKVAEAPAYFEDAGVTVAAFMLDDENASTAKEFGSGGVNSEDVRKQILKAIQEEGECF